MTGESEETVLSAYITKILDDYWDGYHDYLTREWDLIPFWLRSVILDKEDIKSFHSYMIPYILTRYIEYWKSYILFY
jgi:hypothetical protein